MYQARRADCREGFLVQADGVHGCDAESSHCAGRNLWTRAFCLTFRTLEEAVEKANNTMYGLSAGVWTDKGSRRAISLRHASGAPGLGIIGQLRLDHAAQGIDVGRSEAEAAFVGGLSVVLAVGLRAPPRALRHAFELLAGHVAEHLVVDARDEGARARELARALEARSAMRPSSSTGALPKSVYQSTSAIVLKPIEIDRRDGQVDRRGEADARWRERRRPRPCCRRACCGSAPPRRCRRG